MHFHIRKVRLPDDYPAIAAVLNANYPEPTTAERLQGEDAKIPSEGRLGRDENGLLTGFDRVKLAAVTDDDLLIGYGLAWRAPWTPPGELNHTLVVMPGYDKQGAGGALYEHLEARARQVGASRLNYSIKDDKPAYMRFAEKRGYVKERHLFESVLDLRNGDTPGDEETDRLLEDMQKFGIAFTTLDRLPDDEREKELHALYCSTTPDIPGNREAVLPFGEWRKWTLGLPGSRPEYVLLAMDGSRMIGLAHLIFTPETNSFYHEFTGVNRRGGAAVSRMP
ncbi:GNAT family N-acetyltransferase [Paenibacillus filicis]|uniref:GNAT family N-acetyltransferase n=1 Tax=Paenibacillus gyeongsangnamensis TaxID=3388067 RepID=A0ABT4QFR7_9BACL|nr:GNAT family N-acetyltransferase [Paenibacillus filicis]MCZ8515705.1 GNAT family N-acetyltransferase [Paenibacillus filicis]